MRGETVGRSGLTIVWFSGAADYALVVGEPIYAFILNKYV